MFMMISLDGFFEGPNHELDWHNVDAEFDEFATAQLRETGEILFGRVTYEMMSKFWPSGQAKEEDPVVAELMNTLPKTVFSKTLKQAGWENTKLVSGDMAGEVRRLKKESGKEIAVFGSSDLAVGLLRQGLLDELRIMINPVVLGQGKRLFQGWDGQLKLELRSDRRFESGNVLVVYMVK